MHISLTAIMSDYKEWQRKKAAMNDAIERYTEERMNDAYGRIHTDGSRSGGQPLIANRKAHTMIIEVLAAWGIEPSNTTPEQLTIATTEALCRAIKQIENLRQPTQASQTPSLFKRMEAAQSLVEPIAENASQPTQSDALQADIDAMKSILWVDTIIDDQEAIAKAFARHRQYGYDQGYYDGQRDRAPTQSDALREALWSMPEPYEYLNKDQLKSIRPYVDALRNWKHRYRAVLQEQSK